MTPTNPTDDFDFDDLPDLPLLEDEGSSVPDTTQEPVAAAQAGEDEGMDLPELMDLELIEVSATPSIESVEPESDEAAPVADAEPELSEEPVHAEATPSIEPEQEEGSHPIPEQSMEPELSEDEQHADAVPEKVVHHVHAVNLATEEETLSDVEIAEFEPASQPEQPPSDEPAVEVPFVEEDPNPGQPDAAFVQDPEQAPSKSVSAVRSRKPLIIGGAVAAVLAIGAAAFLFWPGAEHQAPVEANVSVSSSPASDSSSPAPAAEPEHELTTADLVSDVLSDQPTPESAADPSAPEEQNPEVQAATPAAKSEPAPALPPNPAAKPAAVVEKPVSAPAPARPAKKPAPQKTEPAKAQDNKWQDEALNALDAFEKGL